MKLIYLLLLSVLIVSCGGLSSPEYVDDVKIKTVLEDISLAFSFSDIDAIMLQYHEDFLHNGDNYELEKAVWEMRLLDFEEIRFDNINIVLDDEKAIVSFDFYLDDQLYKEPETFGDISYFFRENNEWKVYGNQITR